MFEILVTLLVLGGLYYAYDKNERKKRNKREAENNKPAPTPAPPVAPESPVVVKPEPTPTKPPKSPSAPRQEFSGHIPFDMNEVKWLNTNVSKWKETSKLTNVSISLNRTNIKHSHNEIWKAVTLGKDSNGKDVWVNANAWIFVEIKGTWYASTFEYMRPKQVRKDLGYRLIPKHTKAPHIKDFQLMHGDIVYVMMSGLARNPKHKSIQERSNVLKVTLA